MKPIDLRSDTITQPTPAMRRAMATAEVGDDFYNEDPTVAALEEKAAGLLEKSAAMLVLSGTMGNLVSILSQTRPGDGIIVGNTSHIYLNEAGNVSTVGGLLPMVVFDQGGVRKPAHVLEEIRRDSVLYAPIRLVCLENTHNAAGGKCLTPMQTIAVAGAAHAHGIKVHIDGARIFNAAIATTASVADLARPSDSITFCLSKGLCCPAGSIVAGSKDFVASARHFRQMLGGGMRQAGVIAAAGLVALDTMVDRLIEDHENARRLAKILVECGFSLDAEVETNIIFAKAPDCAVDQSVVHSALRKEGVLINPPRRGRFRFVTHADVGAEMIEQTGARIAKAVLPLFSNITGRGAS
jgi:threonine aldolase